MVVTVWLGSHRVVRESKARLAVPGKATSGCRIVFLARPLFSRVLCVCVSVSRYDRWRIARCVGRGRKQSSECLGRYRW